MKCVSVVVLCVLLTCLAVRADSVDEAEAQRRGVSVEKIQLERAQDRIAQLEKQLADAKAAPAATATQPAKAMPLADALKGMPAALRPKDGESERHVAERNDWLNQNVVGKTIVVRFAAVNPSSDSMVGRDGTEHVIKCTFSAEIGQKVFSGDMVTISGEVSKVVANQAWHAAGSGSSDEFYLRDCRLVSLTKGK